MTRGTSPPARQALTDAPPVKVLVVDDNAGFRESLVTLLDTGGPEVVGRRPGAEALDLVAGSSPTSC